MQAAELRTVRAECAELARWSFSAEQQVLRRLDRAFKAFFGRIKRGENGFPRFRAKARYHAAEMRVGDGLTIRKSGRLGFVGVSGEIKVRWHRTLPSKPASAILTRQNGKWYVVFHVEVAAAAAHANTNTIGIDLGLTALVALSNGEKVERPRWTKRTEKGLRRRQRALARCKRGSKRRARPSRCGGAHTQRGRIGSRARASNRRAAVSNLDRKTWNNSCGSIFCFCELLALVACKQRSGTLFSKRRNRNDQPAFN